MWFVGSYCLVNLCELAPKTQLVALAFTLAFKMIGLGIEYLWKGLEDVDHEHIPADNNNTITDILRLRGHWVHQ